jgi:hypothetical protein
VNKSSNEIFDPLPSEKYGNFVCHNMMDLLQKLCPEMTNLWEKIHISQDEKTNAHAAALDIVAKMYIEGRGDHVSPIAQWNIPFSPTESKSYLKLMEYKHSYDMTRTQEDLCDTFGADDKTAPREW